MKDRDFLIWLHNRLSNVHKEIETMDYMHKLRNIIKETDPERRTKNEYAGNNMEELRKILKGK
jgi:hypothetical protein